MGAKVCCPKREYDNQEFTSQPDIRNRESRQVMIIPEMKIQQKNLQTEIKNNLQAPLVNDMEENQIFLNLGSSFCEQQTIKSGQISSRSLTAEENAIVQESHSIALCCLIQLIQKYTLVQQQYGICVQGHLFDLTLEKLFKLAEALRNVQFRYALMGDTNDQIIAFSIKKDRQNTIYLCKSFFKMKQELGISSQPGTIIHEVSHFKHVLDLVDYNGKMFVREKKKLVNVQTVKKDDTVDEINEKMSSLYKEINKEQAQQFVQEKDEKVDPYRSLQEMLEDIHDNPQETQELLEFITRSYQRNANNLQHEIEFRYSHKGEYIFERWSCCGEQEKGGICQLMSNFISGVHTGSFHQPHPSDLALKFNEKQDTDSMFENMKQNMLNKQEFNFENNKYWSQQKEPMLSQLSNSHHIVDVCFNRSEDSHWTCCGVSEFDSKCTLVNESFKIHVLVQQYMYKTCLFEEENLNRRKRILMITGSALQMEQFSMQLTVIKEVKEAKLFQLLQDSAWKNIGNPSSLRLFGHYSKFINLFHDAKTRDEEVDQMKKFLTFFDSETKYRQERNLNFSSSIQLTQWLSDKEWRKVKDERKGNMQEAVSRLKQEINDDGILFV
ncbi:hypothetical protein FGO68_gene3124 [Halteria grandinella]|uniref:Lysine-specific metallo-endopeptidase domain-containing protein n=1 Tax=Halteria grandinella TaxID=5974 RepID=A0A8J8NYB9_HALGN|nr:hypothetical protein FGO68_gene3124 [Halteria grandinella]